MANKITNLIQKNYASPKKIIMHLIYENEETIDIYYLSEPGENLKMFRKTG
jgi:hypothetical protein